MMKIKGKSVRLGPSRMLAVGTHFARERENWEHGKDVAGSRADSYLLVQSNAADVTALITMIAPISYGVITVHRAHAACKWPGVFLQLKHAAAAADWFRIRTSDNNGHPSRQAPACNAMHHISINNNVIYNGNHQQFVRPVWFVNG
ncbi:hypothetical protein CRG98_005049 [Punica granatum]|uniref:Uncharacterized protein n=1 Tax=Punica granatum TaxID=22663 RepID=A0A2I0L1Z3_PUNGR|nr:hypothetical protein CRG98_005049 [Punica granatum]